MISKLMQESLIWQIRERDHLDPEKMEKLLKMGYCLKAARRKIDGIDGVA